MKNIVEQILPILIEDNKKTIEKYYENKQYMAKPYFYYSMKTIELRLARGSGHSSAIANMADPVNDLVVIDTKNRYIYMEKFLKHGIKPIPMQDIINGKLQAIKKDAFKRVFVDDAERTFNDFNKKEFYEYISRFDIEIIILLG